MFPCIMDLEIWNIQIFFALSELSLSQYLGIFWLKEKHIQLMNSV